MEQIKVSMKLSPTLKKYYDNIKIYDKLHLLDLFKLLNKIYFKIPQNIIRERLNLFFSETDKITDIKTKTTIITFQHILITTYTAKFGILTKLPNRNRFYIYTFKSNKYIQEAQIEKLIFDSCAISENMYYFNKTIYSSTNHYYYLITLMIVLYMFNIDLHILTRDNNMMILKFNNGMIIKCIYNSNILIDYYLDRMNRLYNLYQFLDDKIKLLDDVITKLKVCDSISSYNTEFGHFSKVENKINIYRNKVAHKYYNGRDMCNLSYMIYTIFYTNNHLEIGEKTPSIKKEFNIMFNHLEFNEISWVNKSMVYIEKEINDTSKPYIKGTIL